MQQSATTLGIEFAQTRARSGAPAALAQLSLRLQAQPAGAWLEAACLVAQQVGEPAALAWLQQAARRWPQVSSFRYWLASALWQQGEVETAEDELRTLLAASPDDMDAALLLARVMRNDGRLGGAAQLMFEIARRPPLSATGLLQGADFIRHCQRQALAAELCEVALESGMRDAPICAQAGMLALELGRFNAARAHLLEAIERGVDPNTWRAHGALALTQKYASADHADFERFARALELPQLSAVARASIRFAQAKAHDDIGDHGRASALLREANASTRLFKPWSARRYRNAVDSLLSAQPGPTLQSSASVPVFVLGLPRSGTTLAAVMLGRLAGVRDRGELPHIAFIEARLREHGQRHDAQMLHDAAQLYYRHLRQDDAPARWYIDKTPTNFLRLDLIAAMFPQAHVVHCRRNRRDTALSLYAQNFGHSDGDFSYAFDDIAAFAQGHDELMAHWRRVLPLPIHTLDYELFAREPERTLARLQRQLGIPDDGAAAAAPPTDGVIGSSSLWQAKQPVYTSSIGRWRSYAAYFPELEGLFADQTL